MSLPSSQAKGLSGSRSFEAILPAKSRSYGDRPALGRASGLQWVDSFRGLLSVGTQQADVRLEPNDVISVRLRALRQKAVASALIVNNELPGNVRFGCNGVDVELLADTLVDGEKHLPESFRQIRCGFRTAIGDSRVRTPKGKSRVHLNRQHVREALQQLKWRQDSIVEQDEAWELRPRIAGDSLPIRLEMAKDGAELRMVRTVLEVLPQQSTAEAAAWSNQALRFNHQLRLVRLSIRDGSLVCEARLHAGLLHPEWLAKTARAITVGCRHVQLPLRVLAEQECVARSYLTVLFSSGEPTKSAGVVG